MRYQLYLRNRNRAHLKWSAYANYGLDAAAAITLGCSESTTRKLIASAREAATDQAQCQPTAPVLVARSKRTGAEVLAVFYPDSQSDKYAGRIGARRLGLDRDVDIRIW